MFSGQASCQTKCVFNNKADAVSKKLKEHKTIYNIFIIAFNPSSSNLYFFKLQRPKVS